MSNELLNMIIKAIITFITVLLTMVVIPYIKSKIGTEKMAEIKAICEIAVRSAEQLFAIEEFAEKKAYVMEYITKKVDELGINMTIEDINNLIESSVNLIKYGEKYTKND